MSKIDQKLDQFLTKPCIFYHVFSMFFDVFLSVFLRCVFSKVPNVFKLYFCYFMTFLQYIFKHNFVCYFSDFLTST